MKGLFLFIKNNRIIYKVSIVGILILMLISVMQINPENINKKSVSGDLVEKDYAIIFSVNEGNVVFLDSINRKRIDNATLTSLGISYGNLDENDYHKIILSGTNFKTTSNIGLIIDNVDVNIVLTDETTNKISSSYNANADEFYGIVNRGGTIKITGEGTLETSCYNLEESNDKNDKATGAISAFTNEEGTGGKVIIKSGTVIAKANGAYGTAIYGGKSVDILGGTVKAYGGNKGSTSGISAQEKIKIDNAIVDVKVSSEDLGVSGIHTEYDGHGDSITISNNAKVNIDVATTKCKEAGSGICSGRLHITESTVNVKMNGNAIVGLKTVYNTGEGYPEEVPAGYKREMIIDRSKVTIKGNKCYDSAAIAAYDSNATISGSEIDINVKNSEKVATENGLYGISVLRGIEDSNEGGDISIDNSNIDIKVYNNVAAAIQATNDITTSNSNIEASVDGEEGSFTVDDVVKNPWMVGIDVGGKLKVNSGRVVAKGKTVAISMENIDSNLVLNPDKNVKVIVASTDYNIAADLDEYNIDSWVNYKYMEIGTIHDYYLKFDAANNTMYKVTTKEDTTTNSEGKTVVKMEDDVCTPIDPGNYEGWSIGIVDDAMIAEREYDVSYKGLPILELDNMQFVTNQLYGLFIDGDCVVNVKDGTSNLIEATSDNNSSLTYSIYSNNNIKFVGDGDIDLYSVKAKKTDDENDSCGIYSVNDIEITNTTINITARGNCTGGIFAKSKDCNIRGGNITLDMQGSKEACGLVSHYGDIEVQGGEIEIKVNNGKHCPAIFTMRNFSITKGKIKIYSSFNNLGISVGEYNYDFNRKQRRILNIWGNINISGGNIEINDQTSNDIVGIYCGKTYLETGGIVRVNLAGKNNIGVFKCCGPFQVKKAGTLEVTASQTMDVAPTLSDSGVTISEAKLISDPTTSIYEGTSAGDVPKYCYVRIQPNYYLTYSVRDKKMYINATTTDATVGNWHEEDGTLVLDGFNFTTSNKIGLKCDGDTTIKLAEGSKNSIVMNNTGTEESSVILSDNKVTITDTGTLDIKSDSTESITKAINITNNALTVNNATVNVNCNGKKSYGIYANNNVNINSANLNINVIAQTGDVAGIISNTTNVFLDKTNCKVNAEVRDGGTSCYGIKAYSVVTIKDSNFSGNIVSKKSVKTNANGYSYYNTSNYVGIYSQGMNLSSGNIAMKMEKSNVTINASINAGAGLMTDDGNIVIDGGNIKASCDDVDDIENTNFDAIRAQDNLEITDSDIYIYGKIGNNMCGVFVQRGIVNIKTSNVYVEILGGNSGNKGITTQFNSININLSQINIIMDNGSAIYNQGCGMQEYAKRIDIGKSNLNIEIGKNNPRLLDNKGIVSCGNVNIEDSNIVMDMYIKEGYVVYAYSDVTFTNANINITVECDNDSENIVGIASENGSISINGGKTVVNLEGGNTAYGIYAANDMNINSANLNTNVIAQTGDVAGIISNTKSVILDNKTNCKVYAEVLNEGKSCYGIYADDVVTIKDSNFSGNIVSNKSEKIPNQNGTNYTYNPYNYAIIYSQGTNLLSDKIAMKMEDSNVTINASINSGLGLYTYVGNIVVDGGNISIGASYDNIEDIEKTDFYATKAGTNLEIKNAKVNIFGKAKFATYGLYAVGRIDIDNLIGNINIFDGTKFNLNRGIIAYSDDINISESIIKIVMDNGIAIEMYGRNNKYLNVKDSDLDIEIGKNSSKLTYNAGIYSESNMSLEYSKIDIDIYTKGGMGICADSDMTFSKVDVNITGKCDNDSNSIFGILSEIQSISINGGKTVVNLEGGNIAYGIKSKNDITVTGGNIIAKGKDGAIVTGAGGNLILSDNGDMATKVIKYSEQFKEQYAENDASVVEYTDLSKALSNYKYVEIGEVPTYYYRFKSENGGEMWKVPKTGTPVNITTSNTPDSGWTIENGTLKLNGFSHITTAEKVLDIVGNANIEVIGNNTLKSIYNTASEYYGIYGNGNLTFIGNGTMNISSINENYENSNYKYYGIYTDYVDVGTDSKNITITNGKYNIIAKESDFYGISGKDIRANKTNININAYSNVNSGSGIYANGNLFIIGNSNVTVTNTKGKGIFAEKKLEVTNSDIISRGEAGAVISNTNDYSIPGIIKASEDYNVNVNNLGTLSLGQYKNNMAITPYKCVYITNVYDIISVDISWTDMSYAYSPGIWNPDTHSFIDKGWNPKTNDGGKIIVSNSGSNMPIKAIINYDKANNSNNSNNSTANSGIDGKLVVYDKDKNIINEGSALDKKLEVRDSFITYLQLIEEPKELFERTSVGSITVTMTD